MRTPARIALVVGAGLGLSLLLPSCGGSASGGSFGLVSCSLGCSGPGSGTIGCGIQDVFVNGELRFEFSQPIDLSSVDAFSFEVTDPILGTSPAATLSLAPGDPHTLIWRPLQTFDSSGSPIFGLDFGTSYSIHIRGVGEDAGGPYIRSIDGTPNAHRLQCGIVATLGLLDPKPGPPIVEVFVQVAEYDAVCGTPTGVVSEELVEVGGSREDVKRDSTIRMVFDDLINPSTLINPLSGVSDTVEVLLDQDGVLADPTDLLPLGGSFTLSLDQAALRTTLIFTPDPGLPSAGASLLEKRKVVLRLSSAIEDLVGNLLANPGDVVLQPECFALPQVTLFESFDDTLREDVSATGAAWGAGGLRPGHGGGSGRLGRLSLASGQTLVLSTDAEDFLDDQGQPLDASIYDPLDIIDPLTPGAAETISGGLFEFSSLRIEPGGTLILMGSQPARLLVRGEARLRGRLDVSGEDADSAWDGSQAFGQPPTTPGPAGGAGGEGGRLPSWIGFEGVPGTIVPPVAPPSLDELDGHPGSGVPDNLFAPSGSFGAGEGGHRWPSMDVDPLLFMPSSSGDILGVVWDIIINCQTKMIGGSGGGGAHALDGGASVNLPFSGGGQPPPVSPDVLGGVAAALGLGIGSDPESDARRLDPEQGFLIGGAGGGGGGSSIAGSRTNGLIFVDCYVLLGGSPASTSSYSQHSSAAGGAGGGALQLQAGRLLQIDGVLDASGGDGGGNPSNEERLSASGGGGGGAALLQSESLLVTEQTLGRIDVSGGSAGVGAGNSLGGRGGAGLLRMETVGSLPSLSVEAAKILPDPEELATLGATPQDILSIGSWPLDEAGPGARSGARSCWMRPEGVYFLLRFLEDEGDELGWDMRVVLDGFGEVSYRGDNPVFGESVEDTFGSELGAAPVLVRFQGARTLVDPLDLCAVELHGADAEIFPGSLTGWVEHPAELNDYFSDPSLRPNLVRYQVVFDRSDEDFGSALEITELRIEVQPE